MSNSSTQANVDTVKAKTLKVKKGSVTAGAKSKKATTRKKNASERRMPDFHIQELQFELERDPCDWTEEEKEEWLNTYGRIIHAAIQPYTQIISVSYMDYDDLWQVAMEVVLHCFDCYNRSLNTKLSTYVYRSVSNQLVSSFRAINTKKRKNDMTNLGFSEVPVTADAANADLSMVDVNSDFSRYDGLHTYDADLDTQVGRRILVQKVMALLETKFTAEESDIFLRCASGESQIEIVASYGLPQATVCGINRRVKLRLYTYLTRSKLVDEDGSY